MTDFTPLQALGPVAPFRSSEPSLTDYLAHYGLAPLLSENIGLYVGYTDTQRYQLWTQVWSPEEPIGTVFVVHGYYDHLGLYRHLLEKLLERRWRVVLWDLPGHGLSSGKRACIDDFAHYGECLGALQEQLEASGLAPRPWLGIGQSTGAAILATDALSRPDENCWAGLVLLAPLVRPTGWPQAGWLHSLVGPFVQSLPRRFGANSTDAEFAAFLRERDPLQPEHLSLNWVSAMRRWMPQLLALPPSDIPTLILQGEQDATVDWEWNLEVLKRKFPNARIERHPEARHHLVNEAECIRDALFRSLDGFVNELEQHVAPTTQERISRC
ncbi:MAG: alpha/beta hydrolase [Halomonas sp.]|nr:alpha/beta hydrolase [Halomonas sp.]MCC5881900.1 alpha/beta hydrolase [Halomonas sp.]